MTAEPLAARAHFILILGIMLICAGCATMPNGGVPVENTATGAPVPSATRFLGQATVYLSATGESLEVVHDASTGIAIVKLPDGSATVLPEEIAGFEGRYRNKHMTVWENDGFVLLWVDGKFVFRGKAAN